MKYSFLNDYCEGAHEDILKALCDTNLIQAPGYGRDEFCTRAADSIRRAVGSPGAQVHFLTGGTQTNLIVIAALLRPYQAVISAETGHINTHETGAVEATGHKVLALPGKAGKLTAGAVEAVLSGHANDPLAEHSVQPGMVYVSQSTELGSVYKKSELSDIYSVCRRYKVPLFVDGARLGAALTSAACDIALPDMPRLCDLFYIGGTKNGALFGEALVINNPEHGANFRYMLKQRGAMLAKGRLLGVQFETLFADGLYLRLAQRANDAARLLAGGISKLGYRFDAEPVTNQLFPIFPRPVIAALEKDYLFNVGRPVDDGHCCVRLCTSWAADLDKLREFLDDLAALS